MNRVIIVAGAPEPALHLLDIQADDIVIGVDRGAYRLAKENIRMHHAFGDFDSVNSEEFVLIQEMCQDIHTFPAEKDDTDFKIALAYALLHYSEYSQFDIYGVLGGKGRIDHFLSNVWLAYEPRFKPYLQKLKFIEGDFETRFLLEGTHRLCNTLGYQYLSLITHEPDTYLAIKGAKYELSRTHLPYPLALISNEYLESQPTVDIDIEGGFLSVWQVKSERQSKKM